MAKPKPLWAPVGRLGPRVRQIDRVIAPETTAIQTLLPGAVAALRAPVVSKGYLRPCAVCGRVQMSYRQLPDGTCRSKSACAEEARGVAA